jgi:rhodanese-related sulfurtransferase
MELPYMQPVYIAFGLFVLITAYNYIKPQGSRNYTSLDTDSAKEMLDDKNVVLIDVRNRDEYNAEHLRGAKNIPLDQLDKRLGKLPRDKDIVVYCEKGGKSIRAIRKLEVAGFSQLHHMHEGLRGWKKADYPTRKRAGAK